MHITPIKNKKDYATALQRIEQLMSAKKNSREGDELDILATLIDAYEATHYTIDNPDPIIAIKERMEELGMNRKALEPALGSKSRVSEILNKKRKLTVEMIRNLTNILHIPANILIQDYKVRA